MSLRITQNVEAFNAYRNLNSTQSAVSKSMARLSSGYRINSAADDAAGLGISESMRSQVRGLAQAQKNIQDGVSMMQTAEGNLDEVHSMLQRVRELAVQYKNGSLDSNAKTSIQNEVNQLASEIDRIGTSAAFNGTKLLSGSAATVSFQVGANDGDVITATTFNLSGTVTTASLSLDDANALSNIDTAITGVSTARAACGRRATARATCNCMPKSLATAAIHPSVEPIAKTPNACGDSRRAATTVTTNSDPLAARSATVL